MVLDAILALHNSSLWSMFLLPSIRLFGYYVVHLSDTFPLYGIAVAALASLFSLIPRAGRMWRFPGLLSRGQEEKERGWGRELSGCAAPNRLAPGRGIQLLLGPGA